MRGFIFTERERRLLEEWLESGVETAETRRLFTWIRQRMSVLRGDLVLMLRVIRELRRRRRWRGNLAGGSGFGSALRAAESGLTRRGRERST